MIYLVQTTSYIDSLNLDYYATDEDELIELAKHIIRYELYRFETIKSVQVYWNQNLIEVKGIPFGSINIEVGKLHIKKVEPFIKPYFKL